MTSRIAKRLRAVTAAAGIAAGGVGLLAGPRVAAAAPGAQPVGAMRPMLIRTDEPPTGYEVTFRYYDPTAKSVLIKGTWSFASEASEAGDDFNVPAAPDGTAHTAAVLPPGGPIRPAQWKPGDFPLQSPDEPSEHWPVAAMVRQPGTGVWTYTVPLPGGWFGYQYLPDCKSATARDCRSITDPANPPRLVACPGCEPASREPFSEVYVPADSRFDPVSVSWQSDDLPPSQRGRLVDLSFPDSQAPGGTASVAVYTPPGYDPRRAVPYPLFVLSHGGGENELAWPDRGRVSEIVDHALAAHETQPMVIVMPKGVGYGSDYQRDVLQGVVPWAQRRYHVSSSASARAFAGTSAFGTQANRFLFDHTAEFGYYGVWSPAGGAPPIIFSGAGRAPTTAAYQAPGLRQVLGIHLAIGRYDVGGNLPQLTAQTDREGFIENGVPFRWFSADGGHTWAFWRLTLHDFLLHTAFRATATSASIHAGAPVDQVSVTVSARTTEPAVPTGSVQLRLDRRDVGDCTAGGSCSPSAIGKPVRLQDGRAVIDVSARVLEQGGDLTVSYSGDRYYDTSVSPRVVIRRTP